jgi:hypothetical protein
MLATRAGRRRRSPRSWPRPVRSRSLQLEVPHARRARRGSACSANGCPARSTVRTARRILHTRAPANPFMALRARSRPYCVIRKASSPNDPLRCRKPAQDPARRPASHDLGPATHELLLHASVVTAPDHDPARAGPWTAPIESRARRRPRALGLIDVSSEQVAVLPTAAAPEFVYAPKPPQRPVVQAHAQLAAVVDEPVENATHRALAAPRRRTRSSAAAIRRGRDGRRRPGQHPAPRRRCGAWRRSERRHPPDERATATDPGR